MSFDTQGDLLSLYHLYSQGFTPCLIFSLSRANHGDDYCYFTVTAPKRNGNFSSLCAFQPTDAISGKRIYEKRQLDLSLYLLIKLYPFSDRLSIILQGILHDFSLRDAPPTTKSARQAQTKQKSQPKSPKARIRNPRRYTQKTRVSALPKPLR